MAKKNNGSNGNGGAPEDAHAVAPTSAPYDGELQEAIARGDVVAELPDQPAEAIPPDQQDHAGATTDELKKTWAALRTRIDGAETDLKRWRDEIQPIETELCARVKKLADVQGTEAIVNIDGRRMKAKLRPAKHGGGLHFVDAPIRAAVEF